MGNDWLVKKEYDNRQRISLTYSNETLKMDLKKETADYQNQLFWVNEIKTEWRCEEHTWMGKVVTLLD